ncbi:MAG: TolC family protein [Cyclobacteriaceae bacterium]|nr:TolC family protein [Cyclobacteriaceae bacterium HetDA_MAG_MS6]
MKYLLSVTIYWMLLPCIAHAQDSDSLNFELEIGRVSAIINNETILDSLVVSAHKASGLLRAFDEEIGMYEEEILQKRRNWVNSFRFGINIFSASTSYSSDNESITTLGVLSNVGLSLVIDPEKIVNRGSYVRQAQRKRDRSAMLRKDHQQRIKGAILNHYYHYLSMLECLVLQEHTLNTRKQHLAFMEVEFRNGTATYDQLLVVQNQYNLWEEQYVKSRIGAMRKRREIEVILGL